MPMQVSAGAGVVVLGSVCCEQPGRLSWAIWRVWSGNLRVPGPSRPSHSTADCRESGTWGVPGSLPQGEMELLQFLPSQPTQHHQQRSVENRNHSIVDASYIIHTAFHYCLSISSAWPVSQCVYMGWWDTLYWSLFTSPFPTLSWPWQHIGHCVCNWPQTSW